jgi:sterol desaturase/sphingolipid hydroxylase (fatty acid hydroxylase superfamily)
VILFAGRYSQKELNIFTDDRGHFVDRLASELLMFVPFLVFQVPDLYAVAVIGLYRSIHNRFVHANVMIDLGWIGWFLVSPEFHRVHHSVNPADADKNFGVLLSVFDHLFGTAHQSQDIYPATGIADARFPTEDRVRVTQLPMNWIMQTIYPFSQLLDRLTPRRLGLYRGR